jgi:hypothetical protein
MAKLDDLRKQRQQLDARIQLKENREKTLARKKRTRELIEIGGLAELAGLRDFDKGALLGALLFLRKLAETEPARVRGWKSNGDQLLAARRAKREARKAE